MPVGMQTAIIGIDGCGGSGKSMLAERLAATLDCAIIHTDDFGEWDNPRWCPRMIKQVLDPLRNNQPARYQRYDWGDKQLAEWHEVPVQPQLIVEGVSALRREFRPYLSYGIYVETPHEIRLKRGLERDGAEALTQWQDWMAAEDGYVARDMPQAVANIVINGDPQIELASNQVAVIDPRPRANGDGIG